MMMMMMMMMMQNHSISPKRLGVWRFCFGTFLSMNFPFRKVYFHHSALMYIAMATTQLFGLILKTRISIVFKYFHLRETLLWDSLCIGHHNTLGSLIEDSINSSSRMFLLLGKNHRHIAYFKGSQEKKDERV